MMIQIKKLFPLAALALFTGACTVSVLDDKPVAVPGEEGRLVTLSLAIPGSPNSRGLDGGPAENAVTTIDVLLFTVDANEHFRYRALATSLTGEEASSQKEFTVRLPEDTWNVVVLANARGAFANSSLTPSHLAEGNTVTRATVLAGLVQQLTAPDNKWTDESFPGIPMWGYSNNLVINSNTPNPAATINLTRAIARVDVSVKDEQTLRGKFYLSSVHLYNYNRAGSLAPAAYTDGGNNVGGYDGAQWNGSKAIAPNLPGLTVLVDDETPLKMENASLVYPITEEQKYEFKQEIYTFEAAAGTANTVTNTCLVIGGYYNAPGKATHALRYYRVEFANKVGEPDQYQYEYLPLLRNHNYSVEIQDVDGDGYATPGEAYHNKPSNIVVNIVDWNDGGLNDTDFTGQYYFSVDKSELVFYADGGEKSLQALTNFPDGWTLDLNGLDSDEGGWLSVVSPNPATGAADQRVTLTLEAPPLGEVNERLGNIFLVAGNFKKPITVRQLNDVEFSLEVSPWELTFYKTPQVSKTVTLSPTPALGSQYEFGLLDVAGDITWTPGGEPAIDGLALTLKPAPNSGQAIRTSTVLVRLNGPNGKAAYGIVNVRQFERDMLFKATPAGSYEAIGVTDATFPVTSEAPWRFTTAAGNGLTLENEESYHAATMTDYFYHFSLTPNPEYAQRVFTVNVESSDEEFLPQSFEIKQAGLPLSLTITDPESKSHDFGTTSTPKEVTFTTNAKSKYTTGAGYADVISAQSVEAGAEMTAAATPSGPLTGSVIFTPQTNNAGWGGSTKSTTVTFSTAVGVDGVTEHSETVTLSRTIPVVFPVFSVSPANNSEIVATATNVTITANTNLQWWVQLGDGNKSYTDEPSTYIEGGMKMVNVPALPIDEAASWTTPGPVIVKAGYDAQTTIEASTIESYTFSRPPYDIEAEISGQTDEDVTITVTTNAASVSIQLIDPKGVIASSQNVFTMTSGNPQTFTLGSASRMIDIKNYVSGALLKSFHHGLADYVLVQGNEVVDCPAGYMLGIPEVDMMASGYSQIDGLHLVRGLGDIVYSIIIGTDGMIYDQYETNFSDYDYTFCIRNGANNSGN